MTDIEKSSYEAVKELIAIAKGGEILIVGCSTSEVSGEKIGTASNEDTAQEIYKGIKKAADEKNVYIAAQCCEHLNRAVILEKEKADQKGYEPVNVRPIKKAGGSFAACCFNHFKAPVAVEYIKADFGIDIGLTMIGMHLKSVAVPFRTKTDKIGSAKIVCARTRPKYIGGERAVYVD